MNAEVEGVANIRGVVGSNGVRHFVVSENHVARTHVDLIGLREVQNRVPLEN